MSRKPKVVTPIAAMTGPALPFELISSRDVADLSPFPKGFGDMYEVLSYRNAVSILAATCRSEFDELVSTLMSFKIQVEDIIKGGGNKSAIAKSVEALFHPLRWNETRVTADLLITRTAYTDPSRRKARDAPRDTKMFKIESFVDGHKIDFVKNRVAFDMEWNSKDQTFDRDLYAMRSFYECNIISAGVLLTRSAALVPVFNEIAARSPVTLSRTKFGASTTWMGKLTYRIDAGRAGGCPILALGIKPEVIEDLQSWLEANPIKRDAALVSEEDAQGAPAEEIEADED